MSESPLPDDVSRWPTNPFELLGVTHGVDEKDLKRAYQRLLRIYRPERNPEQFRRIRDAYDSIREYARHVTFTSGPDATVDDETPPPTADSESRATAAVDEAAVVEPPTGPRPPSYEDRLHDAGAAAREGKTVEAFAEFARLTEEAPFRDEAWLACYWLARLEPKVAAGRDPIGLLTSALDRCPRSAPVLETYLNALEHDLTRAIAGDTAVTAFRLPDGGDVVRCLDVRWRAAAQRDEWHIVLSDLNEFRISPWWLNRDVWLAAMTAALETAVYSVEREPQQVANWCRRELGQYPNLHASQFDALARLDYLYDEAGVAVRGLHTKRQLVPLRRMLSLPASADPREAYLDLTLFVEECEFDPRTVLQRLSMLGVGPISLFPRLSQLLGGMVWALGRYDESNWTPDELGPSLGEFFGQAQPSYGAARAKLLDYCLERHASPMDVVRAINENERTRSNLMANIATLILDDQPLHCAYAMLRIFES